MLIRIFAKVSLNIYKCNRVWILIHLRLVFTDFIDEYKSQYNLIKYAFLFPSLDWIRSLDLPD